MGMRGWLRNVVGGRRRRAPLTLEAVEIARKEEQVKMARLGRIAAQALLNHPDPDKVDLGVAMVSRSAARAVAAAQQRRENDPMVQLAHELIAAQVKRDPLADLTKLATLSKALKGLAGDEDDGAWGRLLNSEAAAALGQGLGQALPALVSGTAGRGAAVPGALDSAPAPLDAAPLVPPEALAAVEEPVQQPVEAVAAPATPAPPGITPEALIHLLEHAPPEHVAATIVRWAREEADPEATGSLDLLLHTPEAQLTAKLQLLLASASPWQPVARWLLDHPDERRAIIAALRALVPDSGAPARPPATTPSTAAALEPTAAPPPAAAPTATAPPAPAAAPDAAPAPVHANGTAAAEDFGL